MSKRCELQKEYYQQYGNYKGNGKYSDKYANWLEEQILSLRLNKDQQILVAFITEIKNEFADQNWDYLDFIAERVIKAKDNEKTILGKSI